MLSAKSLDFSSPDTAINCWRVIEIDNLAIVNSVIAVCPNQFWADFLCQMLNQKENTITDLYQVKRPGERI